jgi:hypothetical protein
MRRFLGDAEASFEESAIYWLIDSAGPEKRLLADMGRWRTRISTVNYAFALSWIVVSRPGLRITSPASE